MADFLKRDPAEELAQFRATYQLQRRNIAGHDWSFISGGAGEQTIVLLPGGGGSAECVFPIIVPLEEHFRVISVGCPPTLTTIRQLIGGTRILLNDLGVQECTLLGHSFGGMLAACFVLTYPAMTQAMVLANAANYSFWRAKTLGALLAVIARLPATALKKGLRWRLSRLLRGHPDREFWMAYFMDYEYPQVGATGVANRIAALRDFLAGWSPSIQLFKEWGGRVLILESENETAFTKGERRALKRLFPTASVHTFADAGHLSFLWQTDEFVDAVVAFMKSMAHERRDQPFDPAGVISIETR